jgi:hypothetical protein
MFKRINIVAARREARHQLKLEELRIEGMKKMHRNIDELSRKGWK